MRKTFLLFCLTFSYLCYSQDCSISAFNVALDDNTGSDTNIRDTPKGDIILKLNKTDEFVLHVIDYKNSWLNLDNVTSVNYGYNVSNLNGWVHQSTVALWTRKKTNLLDAAKVGVTIGFIDGENGPVKLKNICEDWAEIEYNGLIGWAPLEMLCGNPVTTCP